MENTFQFTPGLSSQTKPSQACPMRCLIHAQLCSRSFLFAALICALLGGWCGSSQKASAQSAFLDVATSFDHIDSTVGSDGTLYFLGIKQPSGTAVIRPMAVNGVFGSEISLGVSSPEAITFGNGNLYIVYNPGLSGILRYNLATGGIATAQVTSGASFGIAFYDIEYSPTVDRLFVAGEYSNSGTRILPGGVGLPTDTDEGSIRAFIASFNPSTLNGISQRNWGYDGPENRARGVTTDESGNVYVVGQVDFDFNSNGTANGVGAFFAIRPVLDQDDPAYIAKFNSSLGLLEHTVSPITGTVPLGTENGLFFAAEYADGFVYAAGNWDGQGVVARYDTTLRLSDYNRVVSLSGGGSVQIYGVAPDPDGGVYFSGEKTSQGSIQFQEPNGNALDVYGELSGSQGFHFFGRLDDDMDHEWVTNPDSPLPTITSGHVRALYNPALDVAFFSGGISAGSMTLGDPNPKTVSASGGRSGFVAAFEPDGDSVQRVRVQMDSISETEEADNPIRVDRIQPLVDGEPVDFGEADNPANGFYSAFDVEIIRGTNLSLTAPSVVYQDISGADITDSVGGDPEEITARAETRLTAVGITLNDNPQTGDPTTFTFTVNSPSDITFNWRVDYALTVDSNFDNTESSSTDDEGNLFAGPLTSKASGNPLPAVQKHWIERGTNVIAQIDGKVIDFSRPGLNIRYVTTGYVAYGAANSATSQTQDEVARINNSIDIREEPVDQPATVDLDGDPNSSEPALRKTFNFQTVGQAPPQRQQVEEFNMYGPSGITYNWKIQYGIQIDVDDQGRNALPRVEVLGNPPTAGAQVNGSGAGVFWYDEGTRVRIGIPAVDDNNKALSGWTNGDAYYFSPQVEIDEQSGALLEVTEAGPAAEGFWRSSYQVAGRQFRGLEIATLLRPARVLWSYDTRVYIVNVEIGDYVFEELILNGLEGQTPNLTSLFEGQPIARTQEPDLIEVTTPTGLSGSDVARWDENGRVLYPLRPSTFEATWRANASDPDDTVRVRVIATFPPDSHYPHIANTPAVNLDPSPDDSYIFKEVFYTQNDAAADQDNLFTASTPGKAVLLFSEIQQVGRSAPAEYLRVRVVETKNYNDGTFTQLPAVIGEKITSPLDRANLGTGYLFFQNSRHNANVYDAEALEGLAIQDVYDMDRLANPNDQELVVAQPGNLPGPIIPVNLHPGATESQRIVVVWYEDPRLHDQLLWPFQAVSYIPQWPAQRDGRIVIASRFGSEGVDENGNDQVVAEAIGDFEEATTYDPSRLQQPVIYNQPDPSLPGYNPNEEHALMAPSLRFASVSPRPPSAYALRRDLNTANEGSLTEAAQPTGYTSHPFVLVQFLDTADNEFKMNVYDIVLEDSNSNLGDKSYDYTFDNPVTMVAGEPVIPFYPLPQVIGASPCAETFGVDGAPGVQQVYFEDVRGTSWAVSGGVLPGLSPPTKANFQAYFYYPLSPNFFWPDEDGDNVPDVQTGDCVPFLNDRTAPSTEITFETKPSEISVPENQVPQVINYEVDWPENPPTLKAGETLTFSGGEFAADFPTQNTINDEGEVVVVQTPGLPGVIGFASAEIVFDALNPTNDDQDAFDNYTARAFQALEARSVEIDLNDYPAALQPANGRVTVLDGKYIFDDLSASLQKRLTYDPTLESLELVGFLNDKPITDPTLTAAPPAVYILEPNVLTAAERDEIKALVNSSVWDDAIDELYAKARNPNRLDSVSSSEPVNPFYVGLEAKIQRNDDGSPQTQTDSFGITSFVRDREQAAPAQALGPGLAVFTNPAFLDPEGTLPNGDDLPDVSYITIAENNSSDLSLPITMHVIRVDRTKRYRGSIKTVLSTNVFDENIILRHTGDFGTNADELVFEWWYRPDDGSLNVPPPDFIQPGQTNPWLLFPDPSGNRGAGRFQATLKGNPNAPEALLADTHWFVRYRHENDIVEGTNWAVDQADGSDSVNFDWAGAGNSQPLVDANLDGIPDYVAQLVFGWIKRVLDGINPYEARVSDFEDISSPSTISSIVAQLGQRFEGPVALNPDKDVIENTGLIELYETVLQRGRNLSIDLSTPISTPAIANALQLAATRISDFYVILGNEAYADAVDPTIGIGSNSIEYGSLAPAVFAFQNQVSTLIEEELALLRGGDQFLARPVYNRMFWNFTKGEGEAAYALNYNVTDVNLDGFINEDDAQTLFPQGHGDAWGHYLTALRNIYDLLKNENFNWVSRSEFYNLQDIVFKVDFLDERKFAQAAAAKAQTGAQIVQNTYRERYVEDPAAQWQGYTDVNPDRAWGVQGWARRAGQGAYFDWITANALLPSQHPNENLEGIQKVDRSTNTDIAVISANLNQVQRTFDQANNGYNPLGISGDAVPFDIDTARLERGGPRTASHFEQIYERAVSALNNAKAIWDYANLNTNRVRAVANSEEELRSDALQQDLAFANQLITIFGQPYEGVIGSGLAYPPGYDGPDFQLFMYVDVREITSETVPQPTLKFADFDDPDGNGILAAFEGKGGDTGLLNFGFLDVPNQWRELFTSNFSGETSADFRNNIENGLFTVNYTDLDPASAKVPLENLQTLYPTTAAGYTFQAPDSWGERISYGELQAIINQMIVQEAALARSIREWDSLQGGLLRAMRLFNARLALRSDLRGLQIGKILNETILGGTIFGLDTASKFFSLGADAAKTLGNDIAKAIPENLPTGGLAVSPGDALSAARAGASSLATSFEFSFKTTALTLDRVSAATKLAKDLINLGLDLAKFEAEQAFAIKSALTDIQSRTSDEPARRVDIFKEIETLRGLSEDYKAKLQEASRIQDKRRAFQRRVAASVQRDRYRDITFRATRNAALEKYRDAFDLAARYTYLAAKAYDYETNFAPGDVGSPRDLMEDTVRARTIGLVENGQPRIGAGGLAEILAILDLNYQLYEGQLGFNNPQTEVGKMSLRTEYFRILPEGSTQPTGLPNPNENSDTLWLNTLEASRVDDLWDVPEFRHFCRPFAPQFDGSGNRVAQPGIVIRFPSTIISGQNFFGQPLGGSDHAFDPTNFATKIRGVGVWFDGYESAELLNDLAESPRVYLIPAGNDIMTIPQSEDLEQRIWTVMDQRIPAPFPALTSDLQSDDYIPLIDSVGGRLGDPRQFSSFRAYHNSNNTINEDELVYDSRLVGRSVWNTEWILIIPGRTLNNDPNLGLDRFVQQVTDIKLFFQTYGFSGG